MGFELKEFDYKEHVLSLMYLHTGEEKVEKEIRVSFKFEWEQPQEFFNKHFMEVKTGKEDQAADALKGVSFVEGQVSHEEIKKLLLDAVTIHVPTSDTFGLLWTILETWKKLKMCPFHIQDLDHPAYPVMTIVYNKEVFPCMRKLVETVLVAIGNAEVTEVAKQEEETKEEEIDILNDEDAEVIEHEVDDEVAAFMKQKGVKKEVKIEPLKEAMPTFEPGGDEE
jgi:hypothetical protein